jgi:HPt (histidine-containing phosphotransfer) domain-containing protein
MNMKDKSPRLTNLEHLYDLASGDKDFIKEMIEYYLSQVPVIKQDLLRYRDQQDWFNLGEIAHKAKSSFKFMGITQLTELAKEIEDICRERPDEKRIHELIKRIQELMVPSSDELRIELSKIAEE